MISTTFNHYMTKTLGKSIILTCDSQVFSVKLLRVY